MPLKLQIIYNLEESFRNQGSDELDDAILKAFQFGLDLDFVEVLNKLLSQKWHFRHEDIARTLQDLKSPSSVDVLFDTVNVELEYLNYDDTKSLARKCIWALADIGTEKAKEKLVLLSNSSDPLIANYARKRLNIWELEISRKGI